MHLLFLSAHMNTLLSRSFREEGRDRPFGLALVIISFLVYANSLGNGFVGDDYSVILNNPVLQGNPISLFHVIDTTSETQLIPYYRPLTYLTFLIEERLHGLSPVLMHLLNVLLHAANAFLVYRLARSLSLDQRAAFLVGLLFAVHPLHSEGVNFLSGGRNTLLACMFVLCAYLAHLRSVLERNIHYAFAGAILFLAGAFSKEIAVAVLPFIAMLELSRIRETAGRETGKAVLRMLPYGACLLCYLLMRWVTLSNLGIQTSMIPGVGIRQLESLYIIPNVTDRLVNNIYIIPRYLLTVIWPVVLNIVHVIPDDLHLFALPLAISWLCIIVGLGWILIRRRNRATLFGLFWFAMFLLPVSGVVFFPGAPIAERFLYMPAIGLWIILADQIVCLVPSGDTGRKFAFAAAALVFFFLAAVTVRRNMDWRSNITLFSRVVEQVPDNARGHAYLGDAYYRKAERDPVDIDVAEREYLRALALDPSLQTVHTPLGSIRMDRGDLEGALYHFTKALSIFPLDRDARINRGIVYERLGRTDEALEEYRLFLSLPGARANAKAYAHAEDRVRAMSGKQ